MTWRLFFVAGEESGDLHGAALITALRQQEPTVACVGYGGSRMRDAGLQLREDLVRLAGVGLDFLTSLPRFAALYRQALQAWERERPSAVVLIDYPGFNLHLAQAAKARKIPVIYFISPQVWAWGEQRVQLIRRVVDLMLVVFRFEEVFYRERGVPVTFVGHPLLDAAAPTVPRDTFLTSLGLSPQQPTLALLPGSRRTEVLRHLPTLLATFRALAQQLPLLQGLLVRSSSVSQEYVQPAIARAGLRIVVVEHHVAECLASARAALVASGTATLQAALLQCPMVIVYQTSWLTYLLARRMVKLPYIGLVNVVAGRPIVPEYIQHQAQPQRLVPVLHQLLTDPAQREVQKQSFLHLRTQLGKPGACARAAHEILSYLAHR